MLKVDNKIIKVNNKWLKVYTEPSLPPYTLRLKFHEGVTPTFSKGTGVQVSSSPNIWDLTYVNSDWSELLAYQFDLLEVIDANSTGVTNMESMFYYCLPLTYVSLFDTHNVTNMNSMFRVCQTLSSVPLYDTSNVTNMSYMLSECQSLASVPLFNTSNVTNMYNMLSYCGSFTTVPLFDTHNVTNMGVMFDSCTSLTLIPLFDTSKVTNMSGMFWNCANVQSGALALYQQASSQAIPPSDHSQTFYNCGTNTTTGSAELAQIPSDWK